MQTPELGELSSIRIGTVGPAFADLGEAAAGVRVVRLIG